MNPNSFDRISKRFAERRLTRRRALVEGTTALSAGTLAAGQRLADAQDATPETVPAEPWDGEKTAYLFVQSFHSGSIAPTEGAEGRYTVTLEQGSGQTIYFGDRPSRDVGAAPTAQFLEGLGFPEDNPPNAALIVETAPGETDIAVVELFNPTIDIDGNAVTYDVEVLENWQEDLELGIRENPADLSMLAPEFGTAHLLIDDCAATTTVRCGKTACELGSGLCYPNIIGQVATVDLCWLTTYLLCVPCLPYGTTERDLCKTVRFWDDRCNADLPDCNGRCWSDYTGRIGNC